MRLVFIIVSVLILGAGCHHKGSKKKGAAAPPPTPTPEKVLSGEQWCSTYELDRSTVYTRYNFAEGTPNTLTQDRIVKTRDGVLQLYTGESKTRWAMQPKDSKTGNVSEGYGVERVSSLELNLYANFFSVFTANDESIVKAVPCMTLFDVNALALPRSMAEFQIRMGQDPSLRYSNSMRDAADFWNRMTLDPVIQEVPATVQEITSRAWCSWHATAPLEENKIRFQVEVKVFHPNGSMSKEWYSDSFDWHAYREGNNDEFIKSHYVAQARDAKRATWKINDKDQRLDTVTVLVTSSADFKISGKIKLVRGRNARMAIFGVNTEKPDYPLIVSTYDTYFDCNDPRPFEFQEGWAKWLPQIIQLQTDALN